MSYHSCNVGNWIFWKDDKTALINDQIEKIREKICEIRGHDQSSPLVTWNARKINPILFRIWQGFQKSGFWSEIRPGSASKWQKTKKVKMSKNDMSKICLSICCPILHAYMFPVDKIISTTCSDFINLIIYG